MGSRGAGPWPRTAPATGGVSSSHPSRGTLSWGIGASPWESVLWEGHRLSRCLRLLRWTVPWRGSFSPSKKVGSRLGHVDEEGRVRYMTDLIYCLLSVLCLASPSISHRELCQHQFKFLSSFSHQWEFNLSLHPRDPFWGGTRGLRRDRERQEEKEGGWGEDWAERLQPYWTISRRYKPSTQHSAWHIVGTEEIFFKCWDNWKTDDRRISDLWRGRSRWRRNEPE